MEILGAPVAEIELHSDAPEAQLAMKGAVARGVSTVFWISLFASLLCLLLSAILPKRNSD